MAEAPFKQEDFQPFFDEVTTLAAEGWRPAMVVYFKPEAPEQILVTTHEIYHGREKWLAKMVYRSMQNRASVKIIPRATKT